MYRMLSNTTSPFERPSVSSIPPSVQKLIAKLQFPKKNRKSVNRSLPVEYSSGKRRINAPIRNAISPPLKKADDSNENHQQSTSSSSTATATPARNKYSFWESIGEPPLFTKRKRTDYPPLVKTGECTSTENTDDLNKELPTTPQENDDSTSTNLSRSFEGGDEILSECSNNKLAIIPDGSDMCTPITRPQTNTLDECNNATAEQKFTTDQEFSQSHSSSENVEENVPVPAEKHQTLDPSNQLIVTDHNNEKQLTSPQISVSNKCNSTIIEQKPVKHPDDLLENSRFSNSEKENISLSTTEQKSDIKKSATATVAKKDDDNCGFITFNNILQFSSRGSFANELFGDDDEEELHGYTPEFQDKSVQVPALTYDPEKSLRSQSDNREKFQALIQQVKGINDMILMANKQKILNSSKLYGTLGDKDA